MRTRPTFLVIGAMKCGTTSLYDLLAEHPEIGMSTIKEPAFFCNEECHTRGWPWYESLFAHAAGRKAIGEASTSYSKKYSYPGVAERIARRLPDVRLIYVVRHPLERIESQWMHGVHAGWHPANFSRALENPSLVDPSRYWSQIDAYRQFFPDDRMLVLFFDDFKLDPQAFMARVYAFLDVDATIRPRGAELPRNASVEIESERPLLNLLRQASLVRRLAQIAPAPWRDGIKRRFFTRRITQRPEWPAAQRRKTLWEIADDVRTFLNFYGRPADFWDLG